MTGFKLFDFLICVLLARHMAWYVVFRGRQPGVYGSWPICNEQVLGFPGGSCLSYPTQEQAQATYAAFVAYERKHVKRAPSSVKEARGQCSFKDVVILLQFVVILVLCYKLMF